MPPGLGPGTSATRLTWRPCPLSGVSPHMAAVSAFRRLLSQGFRLLSGGGPYPCPACPTVYTHRRGLTEHMKKHSGKTTCPLCQQTFVTVYNMRMHMMSKHRMTKQEVSRMTSKRPYYRSADLAPSVTSMGFFAAGATNAPSTRATDAPATSSPESFASSQPPRTS